METNMSLSYNWCSILTTSPLGLLGYTRICFIEKRSHFNEKRKNSQWEKRNDAVKQRMVDRAAQWSSFMGEDIWDSSQATEAFRGHAGVR